MNPGINKNKKAARIMVALILISIMVIALTTLFFNWKGLAEMPPLDKWVTPNYYEAN